MKARFSFRPRTLPCPFAAQGCGRLFTERSGITRHVTAAHASLPTAPSQASELVGVTTAGEDPRPPTSHASPDLAADEAEVETFPAPAGVPPLPDHISDEYHPFLNGMYFACISVCLLIL